MLRRLTITVSLALAFWTLSACGKEDAPAAYEQPKTGTAPAPAASPAPALRSVMEQFVASLPAGETVQWYAVGARGRSFVAKLTRPASGGGVAADVYVTGLNGGMHPFRGQIPGGRGAPIVLLTPANDAAKGSQVLVLILTPAPDSAERLQVSAVLEDRTLTTLAPTDPARAQAMIASILNQPGDLERLKARAAELKAVDYAQHGFGPGARKPGDEVILVLQGAADGASIWGSGPYTGDSDPRRAAVHAGLLKNGEWGIVRAKFGPGRDSYEASTKNGVKTGSWKQFAVSYDLEKVD